MYERDRQTDTHRDRWTLHDGTGRACIASHGKNDKNCQIQLVDCNSLLYGTTERNLNRLQKVECDSSHRAPGFLPDERHSSAPTAALVTDQTTDQVQAGDTYFQGEVLSDITVSSRIALRPSGCQNTSIYYRSTVLPTICVHHLRLTGVLLLCTSSLELSRDIHKIGEHFQ